MKAVRIFEHGDTSVLRFDEYPVPAPGAEDVLVRVLATSVSRWDVTYRVGAWNNGPYKGRGNPGRRMFPLPMQLGRDAVGVVESTGPAVTRFRTGDRVVALPHPENPWCTEAIRGLGNLSTEIDLPAHTTFGGNAQFVALPEHYWLPLPDGVPPQSAAAAMWSYSTSHRILVDRLSSRLNDTVVIAGASGGMGSACVDLAVAMGVRVIGLTRDSEKSGYLERRGASVVLVVDPDDAESVDLAASDIRRLTHGRGADGAIEFTGDRRLLRLCIDGIRLGGTIVPVGADWTGTPIPLTDQDLTRLELNIRGIRGSRLDDQRIVLELLARDAITPEIFDVMPLAQAAQAHLLLEAGQATGRIVLDPWHGREQ
jgi:NADPH:quinone reductase-like Zn-dependent oxidoreductase